MLVKPVQKKIKIKKRKRSNNKVLGVLFFLLVFLIGLFVVLQNTLPKKIVISPIPQGVLSNNTLKTDNTFNALLVVLKKNNINFTAISEYNKNSILVRLSSGEEVIFSQYKNFELQTSSLQLILSRLTIEGKRFSRLDFRFEKPVITLK